MTKRTAKASPAARRRATSRPDDGNAFIPDPGDGPAHTDEDLAEALGEEFITAATSGEQTTEDVLNDLVPEELGGPFVTTAASEEFAGGVDAANPRGAKREPLPRANAGLVTSAPEELDAERDEDDRDE